MSVNFSFLWIPRAPLAPVAGDGLTVARVG